VAELKTQGETNSSAKILEQYCRYEAGDVVISLLCQDHPELEGWEGYDVELTWDQLDKNSRVCPEFQRVVKKGLVSKVVYLWSNQRVVSCHWIG
jgi:hypothetical protein